MMPKVAGGDMIEFEQIMREIAERRGLIYVAVA